MVLESQKNGTGTPKIWNYNPHKIGFGIPKNRDCKPKNFELLSQKKSGWESPKNRDWNPKNLQL